MRQGLKPYRKRKIFKRKTGGPKYILGRKEAQSFKMPEIPDFRKLMLSIFGSPWQRSSIKQVILPKNTLTNV